MVTILENPPVMMYFKLFDIAPTEIYFLSEGGNFIIWY